MNQEAKWGIGATPWEYVAAGHPFIGGAISRSVAGDHAVVLLHASQVKAWQECLPSSMVRFEEMRLPGKENKESSQ